MYSGDKISEGQELTFSNLNIQNPIKIIALNFTRNPRQGRKSEKSHWTVGAAENLIRKLYFHEKPENMRRHFDEK